MKITWSWEEERWILWLSLFFTTETIIWNVSEIHWIILKLICSEGEKSIKIECFCLSWNRICPQVLLMFKANSYAFYRLFRNNWMPGQIKIKMDTKYEWLRIFETKLRISSTSTWYEFSTKQDFSLICITKRLKWHNNQNASQFNSLIYLPQKRLIDEINYWS